jgi:hypothetical protein
MNAIEQEEMEQMMISTPPEEEHANEMLTP